jgi:hypothetical protein
MRRLRRPDGGRLLALASPAGLLAYHAVVRGWRPGPIGLAFVATMVLLVVGAAFVEGVLGSPLYPLVGGAVIVGFYLHRAARTGDPWDVVGATVGVAFGAYGLVELLAADEPSGSPD